MKYTEWNWNQDLITNQEMIDYQHKTLFRTINDLIKACNLSDEPNGLLVEIALDELLKYAGYHFREEENLMETRHYAKLEAHRAQHVSFANSMGNFKKKFDEGVDVSHELITFMQSWLVNHIMTLDKEAMKACV